jgi:hypothetical protein
MLKYLYQLLFTNRHDIYPVKTKSNEKAEKKATGAAHNHIDTDQYDEAGGG